MEATMEAWYVDGPEFIRAGMVRMFEFADREIIVRPFANPQDLAAELALSARPPAFVITNYGDGRGVQLARQVRNLYPQMPIILLSGFLTGSPELDEVYSRSFDILLPSPCGIQEMRMAFAAVRSRILAE